MKTRLLTTIGLALAIGTMGCAHAEGTEPHEMSAVEHEAAAEQEEQTAGGHQTEYDPDATGTDAGCVPGERGAACWTSRMNPTAEHRGDAGRHREIAAQHRAASEALRNAEASACSGVPEEDRDMSPFMHREDIRSVTPLTEEVGHGRARATHTAGAVIVFNAVPGITEEWLQRVVNCHIARNAAIGHPQASEEMPGCPLTLNGVEANVASVGDGFSVTVRSSSVETANQILERAQALTGGAE